jgi:glycosyltransferase involved in cell wall biosynthesis
MRTYQPDYIWTSLTRATLLGQIVGALRGISVVSWQHNAFLKPGNRLLLRAMQRLSVLWVGDSQSVSDLTADRMGVGPDRLVTWPIFAADAQGSQAVPWRPGQTLRLGSLGRLHRAKGYDILIAALAILRANGFEAPVPFEVVIGGEGGERAALESAVLEAGISNLRLGGYIERPRDFLVGRHLYLQPSRREGLCVAAHEAMQAGLPVLVSAVGELPYSVEDGVTGLVVPPADPQALARALATLLSAPDRLAAMGQLGRDRILDRFGADRFNRSGRDIVERLAARAR